MAQRGWLRMIDRGFVHLHLHSVFSFLDSTCRLDRLVARVAELGMSAVAVTDHDGVYGAVRFYRAAQEANIKPILGTELTTEGGYHLVLLAASREGYSNICKMVTAGRFRALREGVESVEGERGSLGAGGPEDQAGVPPTGSSGIAVPKHRGPARLTVDELRKEPRCEFSTIAKCAEGVIALSGCRSGEVSAAVRRGDVEAARHAVRCLQGIFGRERFFIELSREESGEEDRLHIARLAALAEEMRAPIVATANVHHITPEEAPVQDVLACIQTLTRRDEWHPIRRRGAERYLKSPHMMAREFASYPEAVANTVRIAEQCSVDLGLGELHLPHFRMRDVVEGREASSRLISRVSGLQTQNADSADVSPAVSEEHPHWWPEPGQLVEGKLAEQLLEWLCWEGAAWRYGIPSPRLHSSRTSPISERLRHELGIIRKLGLCEYFLVIWDIMQEARARGIRCAGRGSAADSIVSYVLGITQVDPLAARLLFERFLNPDRRGMPDIDIDFDSRRRDEMLAYVADRYGAEHTGMVATINTYNARSAIREVGKAIGMSEPLIDRISKSMPHIAASRIRDAIARLPELRGSGFEAAALRELLDICEAIDGFPRHLSVHLGGVVISRDPITDFTPLEISAKGVIVCQFDKDDVEALGLVKMDILGLRNLAAIEEALHIIRETRGESLDLAHIPLDDERTFALLRSARTVGVFQLESPGMRGLLSRLQPTRFDDIIANISLFRPGPMQADMIGPYLARRHNEEPVEFLHPALRSALEDTYGVILYQEQVLAVASALAGFTFGQSDSLRRAMTHDRSTEEMANIHDAFLKGCRRRGVDDATAKEAFRRLSAFAAYGFCKAHAASFAIIAYQTAYLKAHHPAEFLAGILSNQPMGFYPPEVMINEAKHFGIEVRPVDINKSRDRHWVEKSAIRVGIAQIVGVSAAGLRTILAAREQGGPFHSLREFCSRAAISRPMVENLIKAGAFDSIGRSRRSLLWELNEITTTGARHRDRMQEARGQLALMNEPASTTAPVALPRPTEREDIASEMAMTGVSIKRHPLYFARERLREMGVLSRAHLDALPARPRCRHRHRPPATADQKWADRRLRDARR
jgi:error-prone DNA polymerase